MPDLITVHEKCIGSKTIPAVSARELHEKLGLKKDFSDWLRQYTSSGDWRNDNDYSVFPLEGENLKGGRPATDAALSMQMAEHIAMQTKTVKGHEVREYFRQARDERDALTQQSSLPSILPTQAELSLAIAQAVVSIERRQLASEQRQAAFEVTQEAHTATLAALQERQPPDGRATVYEYLKRYSKPHIPDVVLDAFKYHCRQAEKPVWFRPDGRDNASPYYTLLALESAYAEATRQLNFLATGTRGKR